MATYTGTGTSTGRMLSGQAIMVDREPLAFPDCPEQQEEYLDGLVKVILAITASPPGHHYAQLWNLLGILKNEEHTLRGRMAAARVEQPVEAAKREFEEWHTRQQVELNKVSVEQARLLQQQLTQWRQLQKQEPQWNWVQKYWTDSTTGVNSSIQASSTDARPISSWVRKYLTTAKDKP